MDNKTLKELALRDPETKKEYESLETEFQLLKEMLRARKNAGKTQEAVAGVMGTKLQSVCRLENGLLKGSASPTLSTLKKYAEAVNCHLEIKFVKN